MTPQLLVGSRKGLFVWSRGPSGWKLDKLHIPGEPVSMLLANEGVLYAGLTLGHFGAKLRRLMPGATEWEECNPPVYPPDLTVNAGPPTGEGVQQTKPASLIEIWELEAGRNGQSGTLWAGTIPGGLFRSHDRGQSWEFIDSLWNRPERAKWFGGGKDDPGIHSVFVDPRDSNRVTLGVSCAGVWRTTDGGGTWANVGQGLRAEYMPPNLQDDPGIQDPHRLAFCHADPGTVWMQHHNGIFLSRDGGDNWREIASAGPSTFGFAVVAHPHDRHTAWFVPGDKDQMRIPKDGRFVVTRTRDGGETFDVLTRGLPTEPAYDLVFRHALDVDSEGQLLAMGSTTGGLWVSENGGDDWTLLSHTLPPIYCVRFGS